jgi:SAM-dependent methyltransferase
METLDPVAAADLVARGYDAIAERYRNWTAEHDPTRSWFLGEVEARIEPGGSVVELGCGSGMPVGRALAARYDYAGVDISQRQIALAREAVPDGRFEIGDLTALALPRESLDAVVACYVMGHVPISARGEVYRRIASWLRPGGWFCGSLTSGDHEGEGVEEDWLGAPMFFASMRWPDERALLEAAGLHVKADRVVVDEEDGVPVAFRWVFARRLGPGVVAREGLPA